MKNDSLFAAVAEMPQLSPASRVWIYTTARPLTDAEQTQLLPQLQRFVQQWTAHNAALKATAEVFANQMIILVVDESHTGASGCSIDKSVHFLEQQSEAIGVDFFDRMRFGWVNEMGQIVFNARDEFAPLKAAGTVTEDTLMVNSLAANLSEMKEKWLIPLGKSWHNRVI